MIRSARRTLMRGFMARTREAVAVTACWIGLTTSSCTFQAHAPRSLSLQNNPAQQSVMAPASQAIFSPGSESDCVLTKGEVHLWCKWITPTIKYSR
jgi:hypothetical protein